jgi:hypothetical protein
MSPIAGTLGIVLGGLLFCAGLLTANTVLVLVGLIVLPVSFVMGLNGPGHRSSTHPE